MRNTVITSLQGVCVFSAMLWMTALDSPGTNIPIIVCLVSLIAFIVLDNFRTKRK